MGKTITSLREEVSSLRRCHELLDSEVNYNVDVAVREAKQVERGFYTNLLRKEKSVS